MDIKHTKFERELKLLIYYIREYGIQHLSFKIEIKDITSKNEKLNEFYAQVHKGFYTAQNNVINSLTTVLKEQKKLKSPLIQARQQKNKDHCKKIEGLLNDVKYQEHVLRKVMDAIAWQIFQYDLSNMRRLYCGHTLIDITDSNLSSELSYIEYFSKEEPAGFVLISDLTSFVQIGDLVIVDPNKKITIAELKEGKVNEKVFELINDIAKTSCPIYLQQRLKKEDHKFLEQFERNLKQIQRSSQISDIITTGYGTDILTGLKLRVSQDVIELDTFTETVYKLSEECHKKGYSVSVIEECLLIGVYDTSKYPSYVFDSWAEGLKIKMPIYDIRQSFFDPLSYPIFLHPFSDKFIMDIVSGRKIIKMTIDINKWLSTFEDEKCTIRWMDKKETARINSKLKGSNKIFDIDGSGIEIQKNGIKQYIGQGIFSRMFTSFNTPSSLKKYFLSDFEHANEMKKKNNESVSSSE